MSSPYAWIIDNDHLSGPGGEFFDPADPDHAEGVSGPRDANLTDEPQGYKADKEELAKNYQHRHQFRMYDDDGELYYTGTLYWDGDPDNPDEDYVYGPLADYGTPNAGAVLIKYTGRREWDCG